MKRFLSGLVAALAAFPIPQACLADGVPGEFDFYVLALSWSPSYCERDGHRDMMQCGEPNGFIVHGLWPQYETGYPEDCRSSMDDWVSSAIIDSLRDIMPGGNLVGAQWRKHGVCSGLGQADYFGLVREAYDKVVIPEQYRTPSQDRSLSPSSIEADFIDANPNLNSGGIAVICEQDMLSEVRICLTKDLEFRTCSDVNRDSCRATHLEVPAVE